MGSSYCSCMRSWVSWHPGHDGLHPCHHPSRCCSSCPCPLQAGRGRDSTPPPLAPVAKSAPFGCRRGGEWCPSGDEFPGLAPWHSEGLQGAHSGDRNQCSGWSLALCAVGLAGGWLEMFIWSMRFPLWLWMDSLHFASVWGSVL